MDLSQMVEYESEDEIEAAFFENFQKFFGKNAILLKKVTLKTPSEKKNTIPDGIVIDFENNQWYVIEVELIRHGVWTHIARQLVTILVALRNEEMVKVLSLKVLECLKQQPETFNQIKTNVKLDPIDALARIQAIFETQPTVYIPIDSSQDEDLLNLCECFKYRTKIIEINKIKDESGKIHYIPDEEMLYISPQTGTDKIDSRDGDVIYSKASPELRALFDEFEKRVFALDSRIQKGKIPQYFKYWLLLSSGFPSDQFLQVIIQVQKKRLWVSLRVGGTINDPQFLAFQYPENYGYGTISHYFFINERSDIEPALDLVKQAIRFVDVELK